MTVSRKGKEAQYLNRRRKGSRCGRGPEKGIDPSYQGPKEKIKTELLQTEMFRQGARVFQGGKKWGLLLKRRGGNIARRYGSKGLVKYTEAIVSRKRSTWRGII